MLLYRNYWVIFFFLMIRPGVVYLGEEDHSGKVSFFTKWCQGYMLSTWFLVCWCWSWLNCVQWFLHYKLLLSFPSVSLLTLWQEITMCSPYLRSGKSYSSLRTGCSYYYSKFFYKGDWSPLPNICIYSVMYLYQYRFVNTCYILHYNPVLFYFVIQIIPGLGIWSSFSQSPPPTWP